MGSLPATRRFNVDSIAIIGAGPSGLAAAKYLLAEQAFSHITIFEQRATVGGIWNYVPFSSSSPRDLSIPQTSPNAGADKPIWRNSDADRVLSNREKGEAMFMSPLYDRLETNIPRGLMGFTDLNWPHESQLFPKHETVMEYIEQYAEEVRNLIKFQTQVMDVRLQDDSGQEQWAVKTQKVERNEVQEEETEVFDAVVVANGHFNVPYIPRVPGMQEWSNKYPGSISHSKFYRRPEEYAGKKVIIVGNSASGIDIGLQIAMVCRWPLLRSQRSESFLLSDPSATKQEKPEILRFAPEDRSVHFADGTVEADVDAILYCTGYFYSFPFFNSLDPPLVSDGTHVENLYQHLLYRPHPTLALPTLNQKIIPFPIAEAQSAVIARLWSDRLALPSEAEMEAWEEQKLKDTGGGRDFHVLKFPKDADYINELYRWSMSAEGHGGKDPPFWDEKAYWMRERFPAIKKAFQDLGEGRHEVRSLEEVGFSFDEWKREKAMEARSLL